MCSPTIARRSSGLIAASASLSPWIRNRNRIAPPWSLSMGRRTRADHLDSEADARLLSDSGARRVLAEEVGADDLLLDGGLPDVAAPLTAVRGQRPATAVHVLRRVHGRLDGALPVRHL